MSDWWTTTRTELPTLIDRLRPDDALIAIRTALREKHEGHALAALSGAVRGFVARRADEANKRTSPEPTAITDDQVKTAIAVLRAYVDGSLQTDLCDELDAAVAMVYQMKA